MFLNINKLKKFIKSIWNQLIIYVLLMILSLEELIIWVNAVINTLTIFQHYVNYADVFSEKNAEKLLFYQDCNHTINTENHKSSYNSLYNLSKTELQMLKEYLDNILVKEWIKCSVSSAEVLVLFVSKNEENLYLCIDYRSLNKIIVKNCHFLSLISKTLNHLSEIKVFIELNLKNAYHCIWIKEDNKWKTAFCTCYNYFKYIIILFELTDAFTIFQTYINQVLVRLVNVFYMIYLNNILIYFSFLAGHQSNIKQILKHLQQYKLYVNLKKCIFYTN